MVTKTASVHRLKVTLKHVKPPVWRRVEVASETRLSELADMLEGAMGWLGGHLHAFDVGGTIYQVPDPDGFGFGRTADERKARLGDVVPTAASKMRWDYDFGDGWEHDIVVEAIEPPREGIDYPVCVAGRRSCPPEDCGGPWGYENLLAALTDPTHPEHEELVEWAPPGFDRDRFDIDEATNDMRAPRPLMGW